MMLLNMAWRNLWRNKRRTLITLASIVASVALCTAMRSVQSGTDEYLVASAVRNTTGFLQIHARGYWDDRSINNTFASSDSLWRILHTDRAISLAVPRLETFMLASSGLHTKGIAVIGIDPILEDGLTMLGKRIVHGSYFVSSNDTGIIIGDMLAEYLHVGAGDSIVLLGQGYHGATAAAQCRIAGIFHFPAEDYNSSIAYLTLSKAQAITEAPNRMTSISMMLGDERSLHDVAQRLRTAFGGTWEIMEWPAMNKALVQSMEEDSREMIFILDILYAVVGFGMFGTMLMVTMERRKELAVMIALGMRRGIVLRGLMIETLLLGGLGAALGIGIIFPLLAYVHANPIVMGGLYRDLMQQFGFEPLLVASLNPSMFWNQGAAVFGLAILSSLYPLWTVARFRILESLKW